MQYQDRSGKKELNYIKFLEDDLKELGSCSTSLLSGVILFCDFFLGFLFLR